MINIKNPLYIFKLYIFSIVRITFFYFKGPHDFSFFNFSFIARVKGFLFKVDPLIYLSIDGDKFIFYSKKDKSIESFTVNKISNSLSLQPGDSVIFSIISNQSMREYINLEIVFHKLLRLITFRSKKLNLYKKASSSKIKEIKKIIKDNKNKSNNKILFNPSFQGKIQYYKNFSKSNILLSYDQSIILANVTKNFLNKEKKYNKVVLNKNIPKRTFVFYLDNISAKTAKEIASRKEEFPNLSRIINNEKFINFDNNLSVSNWTLPAAISMITGLNYEEHKLFHPKVKFFQTINQALIKSPGSVGFSEIENLRKFRCGTNWRLQSEHGLNSIYEHCMSSPIFADCYTTLSQAIKQLDIASYDQSLHWVDFMDSHHPVLGSILPYKSDAINPSTLKNGMLYNTGPKNKTNYFKNSSKNIYLAQISTIDNIVGQILSYSYRKINPEDHLILLLSDHGTEFMNQSSQYESLLEKHQVMLGLLWPKMENKIYKKLKDINLIPSEIYKLIRYIYNPQLFDFKDGKYSYSQLLYPLTPYFFMAFDPNENSAYCYQSTNTLNLKKSFSNFGELSINKSSLIDLFYNGKWTKLNKKESLHLEKEELPINLREFYDSIAKTWMDQKN